MSSRANGLSALGVYAPCPRIAKPASCVALLRSQRLLCLLLFQLTVCPAYLAASFCMAAFGTAFSSVHRRLCEAPRSCACPFRPSGLAAPRPCGFAKQRRAQRSVEQRIKPHQRCPTLRLQAAGDIALPGPTGPAEDAVLPEAGLINPSVLNSEYDQEIIGLAVPALGSILVDPMLSLVDTGQKSACTDMKALFRLACLLVLVIVELADITCFCPGSFGWKARFCTAGSCGLEWCLVQFLQLSFLFPHGCHHAKGCLSSCSKQS